MRTTKTFLAIVFLAASSGAFTQPYIGMSRHIVSSSRFATEKVAKQVTGKELEKILGNLDMPLVVDAFATWCGPSVTIGPEFEAAAKQLEGNVRFVTIDTEKEEMMAARYRIDDLPTLLFWDTNEGDEVPKAVLKAHLEGAIGKDKILQLCEQYFSLKAKADSKIVESSVPEIADEGKENIEVETNVEVPAKLSFWRRIFRKKM